MQPTQRWMAGVLVCLPFSPGGLRAADCAMTPAFTFHKTEVHGSIDGSLLWASALAIDVDGAPNAYHPIGTKKGALISICNGADAIVNGSKISGADDCDAFIKNYYEARDAGWVADGKPRISFYGVATKGNSGNDLYTPCLQTEGPFEGFFVSPTSLVANASKGSCDTGRYLDALAVPFFVLPGGSDFQKRGIKLGDIAAVLGPAGKVVFAVFGDGGPPGKLGEGSLALALLLRGMPVNPKPTQNDVANAALAGGVHMLVFPHSNPQPPYVAQHIAQAGQRLLSAWGGEDRLRACVASLQ